jgi:hypothetical protein
MTRASWERRNLYVLIPLDPLADEPRAAPDAILGELVLALVSEPYRV